MPETEQEKSITSFLEVIRELRMGKTAIELSEKITDVVAAVIKTGKKGSITLKLQIEPATTGDEISQLIVSEEVTLKVPEKSKPDTLFFSNSHGVMMRFDPRQEKLDLKVVEMPKEEMKEVG